MNLPPPPDIFESLRMFRSCSLFCDVRIEYPDSRLNFFVHRVVVAAASPYFRSVLTEPDQIQVHNGVILSLTLYKNYYLNDTIMIV